MVSNYQSIVDALAALAGGLLVVAAAYLGWWVANRNARNRAAALKLGLPMSRDVAASTVNWKDMEYLRIDRASSDDPQIDAMTAEFDLRSLARMAQVSHGKYVKAKDQRDALLRGEQLGAVYRDLLDEIAQLREALDTAQGEAYLGTLDSDETPDPLAACHNVIKACQATLPPPKELERDA